MRLNYLEYDFLNLLIYAKVCSFKLKFHRGWIILKDSILWNVIFKLKLISFSANNLLKSSFLLILYLCIYLCSFLCYLIQAYQSLQLAKLLSHYDSFSLIRSNHTTNESFLN